MLHFRILQDSRIVQAIQAVEASQTGANYLDIIKVIFTYLPQILTALHDPVALVQLIIKLLTGNTTAAMPPASPVTPAVATIKR